MISDKLNKIIYNKVYNDLSQVEIIPHGDHIWFIDRDNKYWYFRYNKDSEELLWRYDFFTQFFSLFSMDNYIFTPIISSWVEEVLNHRVDTTEMFGSFSMERVEEVLNHRVDTTYSLSIPARCEVEEVLNHKVTTTEQRCYLKPQEVEEVLNQ